MDQEKSSKVSQEGETKAHENEEPPLESVEQPEDSAIEVEPDEIECQPNGNEIQASDTEQEFEESVPNSEPLPNNESASNIESVPEADPDNTEREPDSECNPESELPLTDPETNVESGDLPASESLKDKTGQNQNRGFKTPKDQNCDKYGWPIGSKYCTEESTSNETSLVEDAEAAAGDDKADIKAAPPEAPKVDEEILFKVTSSYVNKRSNMRKTVINVEDVEGAITDGIQAGTHLPHFVTYLGQKIKFRLTLTRSPDKKLKITIKFGGTGVEILKKIICLWLRREDEDKDKILCQGLTRNKEEFLIVLAQKFKEIEHIKEDPVALFEEIKKLVPELRGKQGLRSKDEAFLSAYKNLDEKLCTLMAILYKEGCKREGEDEETLAAFRDMYFEIQIKPEFTLKQYLWAFYYYNLIFTPHICRDLEKLMEQYAALKNITLPSTPALIFPPGGQTSTVINPYLKKKETTLEEMMKAALSSDGFIPPEGDQFKKPMNPKKRTAQRRRQAYQRNRKGDIASNRGYSTNQKNGPNQRNVSNQRSLPSPRNSSNQRNNPRNQSNQRNPSNQRNQQNPRNPSLRSPDNQRSQPAQRTPANKRRQGNQGGSANKKRPLNEGGLPVQGDSPVAPIPANQANQPNPKKPANRRKPPGQRNNQPSQRNNQPNPRNNQSNSRNNQVSQRSNQVSQRNNQVSQRNNQVTQRNNQITQRNNQQNQRSNQRNSRPRRRRPELRIREQNRVQNREQNFPMEIPRNLFSSSRNQDFLSMNLRNDDFMQHNDLRNQDLFERRSQSFSNNRRSPSFSQSNARNQSFSQGSQSHSSNFSQSNTPRSLFSQDFFDMPSSHNQSFSQNNSMGQSFSQQDSLRMPGRASDFFVNSQDFFSGPSNFSNRSSSMNRIRDEMQLSAFNSRMQFGNEMNAHNFSNSSPDNNWDDKSNRGKRRNYRDSWSTKRQKQGT